MASGLFTLKQQVQALRQGAWNGQKPKSVEYLLVAGGGGGGSGNSGGGGGGGGVVSGIANVTTGTAYTVTVGGGGAGVLNNSGTSGENSVFGPITALGGGYGGGNVNGGSGGSGGGSGGDATTIGGQGTANQGNAGGKGANTTGSDAFSTGGGVFAGGGGGAGTIGGTYYKGPAGRSGSGGIGAASAITGTVTTYAGGGGGGGDGRSVNGAAGTGGTGGGGSGSLLAAGTNGTANTGGGGGGGGYNPTTFYAGGSGGSGIVAISYPDIYAAPASTTGSPTVSTSGSGSLSFNGSNQVLIYNSNSAFQFGTGNFTWETWVYNLGGTVAFFDLGAANAAGSFAVFVSSGIIYVRVDGSTNDLTYTHPGGFINNWVHLAVVRNGSTLTLYYNGVAVASGTRANNLTQSTPYIGNLGGFTGYYFGGYLSNTRVVKGTAVYTGNFTPSTTPLAAISGTSLLLSAISGGFTADLSTNGFTPHSSSVSPTWNSSSPFATGMGYKNRVYTWTSSGSITF